MHMDGSCLHRFYGTTESKRSLQFLHHDDLHKHGFLPLHRLEETSSRAALCEGKQGFQSAPFCRETILLKFRRLSKAAVATKYLLSHRDHYVPWFI